MTRPLYWYGAVAGFALLIFGMISALGMIALEAAVPGPVVSLEDIAGVAAVLFAGISLIGASAYLEGVAE